MGCWSCSSAHVEECVIRGRLTGSHGGVPWWRTSRPLSDRSSGSIQVVIERKWGWLTTGLPSDEMRSAETVDCKEGDGSGVHTFPGGFIEDGREEERVGWSEMGDVEGRFQEGPTASGIAELAPVCRARAAGGGNGARSDPNGSHAIGAACAASAGLALRHIARPRRHE